jgi:hypothetical protein
MVSLRQCSHMIIQSQSTRPCRRQRGGLLLVLTMLVTLHLAQAQNGPTILFSTGFEDPPYQREFTLADQDGWLSDASGGNQIFAGYFPDLGQHALVGFSEPEEDVSSVSVWRPINFNPIAAGQPVVTFRVTMAIADSENAARRDSFRWSVYNTNASPHRLFSLDFDNADRSIAYLLDDDQGFVLTPFLFERDGLYDLVVTMHFAHNRWSATLNDEVFVTDLPITTQNASLHLGDISAVWIRAAGNEQFGDNFMVFDNYSIEATTVAQPRLQLLERRPNGDVSLRLTVDPGLNYTVEASSDLLLWLPIHTQLASDSTFEFLDTAAAGQVHRFYRARLAD